MSQITNVQIEESWKEALKEEFQKPYFLEIKSFLVKAKKEGKIIYPPGPLIFNAFNSTPLDKLRVVILGQDPYHGHGQAMGLSFSVPKSIAVPASLKNIYKELNRDLGIAIPKHGDLTNWAKQGVFLLNAMLSVEHGRASSHKNIGWQTFTDAVIKTISDRCEGVVFLLWGNFAKNKKGLIDEMKHYVLESVHPSPLAGNGFQGCGHFSKTNELLKKQGKKTINWAIE
jgi:uracil-DNA glycosylase